MQKKFITNLGFLLLLNLLIKPFWVLGVSVGVQNAVGPESFGVYYAMLNFSYLFHIILDFGINNYQNRNMSQNPQRAGSLISSLAVIKLFFGFTFLGLVLMVGKWYMHYNDQYIYLLSIIGFNQILMSMLLFLRANLAGLQYFKIDSVLSILDRLLMIIICGYLLWFYNEPFQIEWFAYAQGAAYALSVLFALGALFSKKAVIVFQARASLIPSIIKQSWPYALLTLIMTIYYRIDVIMLEHMLPDGAHQAGIYAQGIRIPEMGNMFALLFAGLLLPMFSKMLAKKESVNSLMSLSFRLLVTPAILGAVFIHFFGKEIALLAFDEEAIATAYVQEILMVTFIPLASTYVFGTLLTANNSLKALNIISIIGVAVNIVLNWYLIPQSGPQGAAYATLGTQVVIITLQLLVIKSTFNVTPRWQLMVSMLLFLIGLWVMGWLLMQLEFNTYLEMIVWLIIAFTMAFLSKMINLKSIKNILKQAE